MPLVQASNILTNFGGTASFTPLIGALIADSFAGRFWTIIVGSVIYELVSLSLFLVCYLLEDCAISYEFIQLITHCPVSCCRAWLASPYRQCYHRSVPRRAQLKRTARQPQRFNSGYCTFLFSSHLLAPVALGLVLLHLLLTSLTWTNQVLLDQESGISSIGTILAWE